MKLLLRASVTGNNSVGNSALMKFFKYESPYFQWAFSICRFLGKVDWQAFCSLHVCMAGMCSSQVSSLLSGLGWSTKRHCADKTVNLLQILGF